MGSIPYKTIILFFLFATLQMSCGHSSDCKVDKFVQKEFSKKFKNIKNINLHKGIGGQLFVDIIFMHEITGIESSVSFGDVSFSKNEEDVQKDVKAWRGWYEEHKCNISRDSIVALEKRIIDSNPWLGFGE
jgi:hypothetical protein